MPTHPDAVHDGRGLALGGLWVADEVIPGTEHPPAEGIVLTGGTGQAGAGVLSHPVKEGPGRERESRVRLGPVFPELPPILAGPWCEGD